MRWLPSPALLWKAVMNNYDTKTWLWEAQINALKSELDVQADKNRKLRDALQYIFDEYGCSMELNDFMEIRNTLGETK